MAQAFRNIAAKSCKQPDLKTKRIVTQIVLFFLRHWSTITCFLNHEVELKCEEGSLPSLLPWITKTRKLQSPRAGVLVGDRPPYIFRVLSSFLPILSPRKPPKLNVHLGYLPPPASLGMFMNIKWKHNYWWNHKCKLRAGNILYLLWCRWQALKKL